MFGRATIRLGIGPHSSCLVVTGFCLKTKTDAGDKVFINVCQGDNVSDCNFDLLTQY